MPSPIAHASVTFVLWPMLRIDRRASIPPRNRWMIGGMIVFMACGADIDFIPLLLGVGIEAIHHGGITHCFAFGVFAAVLFTFIGRLLVPASVIRLFCIGCAAWWSHVILDMFTPGGGVMALWPFSHERIHSPIPLFFGAEHSQPFAFHLHLITLLTELPFALLMWWTGRRVARWNAYAELRCRANECAQTEAGQSARTTTSAA